jgi:hypothetical protein
METEFSLRNIVFLNKNSSVLHEDRTMDYVQKHKIYTIFTDRYRAFRIECIFKSNFKFCINIWKISPNFYFYK